MSKLISCPNCNSANICMISYGYPADEEEYLKLVAEKKIYPGGCCTDEESPAWYCNDCENKWGRCSDTNSFDYDQGFDLDEVYE